MDKSQVRSCLSASGSITYDPLTGVIGGGGGGVTPAALTKVDDTNVTLTLGGTPATALLQATSLTLGWTGQLSIARGGTGLGTLGTANQLLRVNAGATALEYFTPTFLTGLTVGTTPITGGTVGRVLFEGAGNVLQENAILNLDTTNGLIIGGATARATRLTAINSANTNATKIFTQRNAADSADYTTLRGDGVIDFNNFSGSTQNTFVSIGGNALITTYFNPTNYCPAIGYGNALTYTAGVVNNINILGSFNTIIGSSGTTFHSIVGNRNIVTNGGSNTIIGQGVHMSGNSRSNAIGGRSTGVTPNVISGNDVTIIGWNTDTTALAYTASLVTYFNNNNASHWLHENGNIGLFGKKYTVHTNSGSNPLNTRMDINATNTLTIHNGTAPSGNITDAIQAYAADITAGNTAMHIRNENGAIIKLYQETTAVGNATLASPGAGTNIKSDDTFDGYTLQQVVKALRNQGLLA